MRVLQGFIDIGGQANRYARALREHGVESQSWLYERTIASEPYDKLLDFTNGGLLNGRWRKIGYCIKALASFDVWHVHKGFSIFHKGKDMTLARKLGKKIIVHYRGREVRPSMDITELPLSVVEKVKREADIAHSLFVKDGQLAELIRPYVPNVIVFPNIVSVEDFVAQEPPGDYFDSKRKLRVTHIPSNPKYKGTEQIRKVVQKLAEKITYTELTGLSHHDVLKEFWQSDIVIDQLLTGTYGNTSLEGMAMGRCVINYLNPSFTSYEPGTPPIVNSSVRELEDTLVWLHLNRNVVIDAGEKGKDFVRRFHSFGTVGEKLIEEYKKLLGSGN